ncbi:hypothetical protein QBZ16_005402 [Prototheca wickerhamii]|uniref:Uncharacterized protein n=1 Tax=Prototheca wickerhamii TaxID=3111 RepID=A0AAD9II36_PROWI|nr:hypothetical protein QBZ16_005402 [Prototheca wickerhamii]
MEEAQKRKVSGHSSNGIAVTAKAEAAARLKEYLALDPEGLLGGSGAAAPAHFSAPPFPVEEEGEAEARRALAALRDADAEDGGWHHMRHKDVLDMAHLAVPGTSEHRVRFEVELPHPVEHLVALLHEWDLLPSWNTTCMDATVLQAPSLWEALVYTAQWLPYPFSDAQVLARARAHDLADEENSVLVTVESEPFPADNARTQPDWTATLPKAIKSRRVVDVLPGTCFNLICLPRDAAGRARSRAEIHVHIDVHLKYVPNALINFVLKFLAPFIYSTAVKILDSHFGGEAPSPWEERMARQPELFGLLTRRVRDVEQGHKAEEEERMREALTDA